MDDLDLSMLRAMYFGQRWSVWGIDPRVSVKQIAEAVGLGRKAARLRLARWRAEGFWNGFDVWPNPDVLGAGVTRFELLLSENQDADEVLTAVGEVEGALRAYTGFGDERSPHPGTAVTVLCLDDHHDSTRDRRLTDFFRLVPERGVRGPFPMSPPPSTRVPDSLDWRIIQAARLSPQHSVRQLATDLGMPERRVRRRWNLLVSSRSLWYIPNLEWSKSPSIVLHIMCDSPDARGEVGNSLERLFPHLLPLDVDPGVYGGRSEPFANLVVSRVSVDSPAAVQQVIARILGLAHVRTVAPDYPLRARSFPDWLNLRIESLARPGSVRIP